MLVLRLGRTKAVNEYLRQWIWHETEETEKHVDFRLQRAEITDRDS